MYLFTRAGRIAPGSVVEAMTFVSAVTEKVHQETGLDVHAWGASMSPELGTVVWATTVESLADLEAAEDKLAVSDPFIALTEKGAKLFAGPFTDRLAQIVSGQGDPSAQPAHYVTVASATAANGKLRQALADGVEVAEAATRISGAQTSFLVDSTGPYGGCSWVAGHPDIASVERGEAALMADDGWLELIDRIGPSFQEGARQSLYRLIL